MKHLYILSAALVGLSATAQPDILYSNFPTSAVSLTAYAITDPGSTSEPTPGANQTWDFSTAQFALSGTTELRPAATTPYAANYPAANWTFINAGTGNPSDHQYLLVSSTGIEAVASHVPSAPNIYSDFQRILAFPLSLGESYTDAFTSPDHNGTDTWTYAGHGTLITSLGTFNDQLMMIGSDDDLVIWNPSPLFPRVIVNDNGATVLVEGIVGIPDVAAPAALRALPNPATNTLQLAGLEGATFTWSILDAQGRMLLKGDNAAASTAAIDVSALATGSYLLVALDGKARRTVRFSKW